MRKTLSAQPEEGTETATKRAIYFHLGILLPYTAQNKIPLVWLVIVPSGLNAAARAKIQRQLLLQPLTKLKHHTGRRREPQYFLYFTTYLILFCNIILLRFACRENNFSQYFQDPDRNNPRGVTTDGLDFTSVPLSGRRTCSRLLNLNFGWAVQSGFRMGDLIWTLDGRRPKLFKYQPYVCRLELT